MAIDITLPHRLCWRTWLFVLVELGLWFVANGRIDSHKYMPGEHKGMKELHACLVLFMPRLEKKL